MIAWNCRPAVIQALNSHIVLNILQRNRKYHLTLVLELSVPGLRNQGLARDAGGSNLRLKKELGEWGHAEWSEGAVKVCHVALPRLQTEAVLAALK